MRLVDIDGDGHPCDESEEQLPKRDGAMVESEPGLGKPGERGREVAGPVGEALKTNSEGALRCGPRSMKEGRKGEGSAGHTWTDPSKGQEPASAVGETDGRNV